MSFVKVGLGLILLAHVIAPGEALDYFAMVAKCTAANNLTDEEVDKFLEPPRNVTEYEDNDAIKCYMNCMLEESRTMHDGNFLIELFRARYTNEAPKTRATMDTLVEACKNAAEQHGANPCDAAYHLYACMEVTYTRMEGPVEGEPRREGEPVTGEPVVEEPVMGEPVMGEPGREDAFVMGEPLIGE